MIGTSHLKEQEFLVPLSRLRMEVRRMQSEISALDP